MLRVGGNLAQLATPAELLTRPADDFVAGFVGRDRGYRALRFETGRQLPDPRRATVVLGKPVAANAAAPDGWVLVVDDGRAPLGWSTPSDGQRPARTRSTDEPLHRGGTLATQGGSLRAALDAALSSPSGRGVLVDDDGRLLGTITAREVLDAIEEP